MNVFEKASQVKRILKDALGSLEEAHLLELVRNAAKWHYDKKKPLGKDEAVVYEVLVKEGYNPYTAYKWLLLTRCPLELQDKLRMRLISQRSAFSEKKELQQLESATEQDLLKDIIQSVERYVLR